MSNDPEGVESAQREKGKRNREDPDKGTTGGKPNASNQQSGSQQTGKQPVSNQPTSKQPSFSSRPQDGRPAERRAEPGHSRPIPQSAPTPKQGKDTSERNAPGADKGAKSTKGKTTNRIAEDGEDEAS